MCLIVVFPSVKVDICHCCQEIVQVVQRATEHSLFNRRSDGEVVSVSMTPLRAVRVDVEGEGYPDHSAIVGVWLCGCLLASKLRLNIFVLANQPAPDRD